MSIPDEEIGSLKPGDVVYECERGWQTRFKKAGTFRAFCVIDGFLYETLEQLHTAAVARGFDGHPNTLHYRLKKGADTWEKLAAPRRKGSEKKAKTMKKKRQSSREEMAALIAAIDSRKAEID